MVPLRRVLPVIFALAVVPSFPGWACAQFFETRSSSSVYLADAAIAAADFNHDGKVDVAGVLFLNGQVAVLLGKGDGTFQPAVYYSVGINPASVGVADFNGDGNPDLAVANYVSGSVSILLGNGDGTFQPKKDVVLSVYPIYVTTGDVNRDGTPDLVLDDNGSTCKCVTVLLGNGDGTFQPEIDTPALNGLSTALGVGDFNGDGKLDVAMAGQFLASSELTVYLGNGDGTFQLGESYSVDSDPEFIATGDFRGIGKLDLLVADFEGVGVNVLLGNGDGTFQLSGTYPTLSSLSIATGDFNGDGKLDFASSNYGCTCGDPAGATVFLGKGDGSFRPGTFYQAGSTGWAVVVADMNNDQKPDIVVGDSNGPIVLLNTGVVRFSPTTPITFPAQLVGTTSGPQTVTLTNTGKKALSITSLSVQGKQFHLDSSTTCATSVPAGGSCNIVTTFQPKTSGSLSGVVSIVDSASKKPQVIELSGTATVVTLSPTQLSFPPQPVGTMSQPQSVTLTNTGTTTLNISKVGFYGRAPWDYSQTNTCGSQVAPGASCTFSVIFAPTQTGTRTATLSITDNGGASPQIVVITGTGT